MTSFGYGQCYQLSDLEKGFASSLNLIGATLSSLICFRYADNIGRKAEVQIGAVLYFVGAAVAAASPVLCGIYIGLTVYGLGIGFAMHAAPVFIAEISPADVRGTLVSAKEAVVVTGIFLGFFVGFVFSGMERVGWRYMIGVSGAFALIMELGIIFVPQSPRFLVLKAVRSRGLLGADEALLTEAMESLRFFRKAENVEEVRAELEVMKNEITASVGTEVAGCADAFKYPRPLLIGCGLVFLQQVTGQPSVLYFATNIFKSAGFGSTAALSSVGVGFVKLLATLVTVWRVDKFGRRQLLLVGIALMTFALALLTLGFYFRYCDQVGVGIADCPQDHITLPRTWAR